MSRFDSVVDVILGLSHEEKLKLRRLLDTELQSATIPDKDVHGPRSDLIGLFADEPDLMDEVVQSVYEQRSRPLRMAE